MFKIVQGHQCLYQGKARQYASHGKHRACLSATVFTPDKSIAV